MPTNQQLLSSYMLYQVRSYHYVCLRLSEQILLKYARPVQAIAAPGISIRVLVVVKGRGRSSEFLANYDVTLSVIMNLIPSQPYPRQTLC
jgi:hypothetical protein